MDFHSSTHKARWMFTRDQLFEIRERTNASSAAAAAVERAKKIRTAGSGVNEADVSNAGASATPGDGDLDGGTAGSGTVTAEDERKLLRFYNGEIVKLCSRLSYPVKVKATALMFFKRFFLYNSCINYNPARFMLTCIYLAGKIEEAYIGAEEFCRMLSHDIKAVLNNEVPLLQGLKFDLIVHSPYRALAGLFEEIKLSIDEGETSGVDDALLSASRQALGRWRGKAESSVDALMMGDAPLLYPPPQLALAALRSALRADGIKLQGFLHRVVQRARRVGSDSGAAADDADEDAAKEDALSALMTALDDIDRLGLEGAQKVDVSDVQEIDKRLKAYKAPADAESARAAASATERDKAERREAKLKARREQQAATEARVLGMPQPAVGQ